MINFSWIFFGISSAQFFVKLNWILHEKKSGLFYVVVIVDFFPQEVINFFWVTNETIVLKFIYIFCIFSMHFFEFLCVIKETRCIFTDQNWDLKHKIQCYHNRSGLLKIASKYLCINKNCNQHFFVCGLVILIPRVTTVFMLLFWMQSIDGNAFEMSL